MRGARLVLAVVLVVGSASIAAAVEDVVAARDIAGWGKTRWGMTEAEVLAALPGEVVRFAKPYKYDADETPLGIEDLELFTKPFTVRFIFDLETRLLNAVNLRLKESNHGIGELVFHWLEKALTEKYGPATYRREDRKRGVSGLDITNVASWRLNRTRIELKFLYFEDAVHHLGLHYEPLAAKKELEEKL